MDKFILTVQKSLLAVSVAMVISPVYAGTDQAEIAQLRQEVQELRTMLQQYVQQKVPVQPITQVAVTASPQVTETTVPKLNLSKGGAEVNLYGYIRADASYQAKGASTMYNNISGVPLENTPEESAQKDQLHSTVNVTRFGLNFKTPTAAGEVGGKLEMDFFGGTTRDQFRIRHAYITLDQWLIGQTWSTFIAPEYYPETVDAGTFVGSALLRSPMLRYSGNLSAKTSFAVAIEDPKYTATSDPDNEMRLPALVGRLNHKFDNGSLLSGRTFMAEKKTSHDNEWAWGVGLGGKYQLSPQTFLKADYYHVKGDGRFLLWANNSYVIDDKNNIQSNEFDTISAGITHQFNSQLRSTLGYGYMKAKDDNTFAEIQKTNITQNKELWQGWINAMYNPYKPITFGVEYVYGERETFDGRNGIDNRVNMMASYDF
ncbi:MULTISPECIES: DcaP family trimeric outer membrane transporter [unclassified Acinetobacter]|uniref:DcaP family trimeric outer membrane transporter n=1 Tax=unclassified Acinetobacter TaxID=196816 RepID=UPI0007A036C6|nr:MULTISPECIES: DcaP family trimeric outer membrane transporter [unclassified Acinetobacter]KYQ82848.1 DcaP-like protein [Acinetobacter sp. NRRL B-65365]OEC91892.1 DcaP-like protein [Acinetobacter sp. YK3]